MNHKKCGGRITIDRSMPDTKTMDLSCFVCGKRWIIDKESNPLAKSLEKIEAKIRVLGYAQGE